MFDISTKGIESAIKTLSRFSENELEKRIKLLIKKAADAGYESASVNFQTAIYAGHNDVVVVEPYWEGNTLVLSAKGKAVAFIEFGTGTHYSKVYPVPVEGIAKRGTYGKGKGANPPWTYVGDPGNTWVEGEVLHAKSDGRYVVKTMGNPPARAMYEAGERMKREIIGLAKEVFS